jgi:hypothetical protein
MKHQRVFNGIDLDQSVGGCLAAAATAAAQDAPVQAATAAQNR